MPLLELRHVQPDEALCGNKQESIWSQEGRGRGLRRRASQISPRLSDHTSARSSNPFDFFGSLPPFLSTPLPHDSLILYLNKPKSCPGLSNSGSECLFLGFYWSYYHISHPIFPKGILCVLKLQQRTSLGLRPWRRSRQVGQADMGRVSYSLCGPCGEGRGQQAPSQLHGALSFAAFVGTSLFVLYYFSFVLRNLLIYLHFFISLKSYI